MIGTTLFEACIESVGEGREATKAGADRLELCVDLAHDGCTPPASLVAECTAAVHVPVIAMVRPSPGDFVYTGAELDAMCRTVGDFAGNGVRGFATGALRSDYSIDASAITRLVSAAGDIRPANVNRILAATHVPALHARWRGWRDEQSPAQQVRGAPLVP